MNEQIIDFLKNYGFILLALLLAIVEIILLLVRKDKKTIIDSSITSKLLTLIIEAESKFGSGHGKEKFQYVLTTYLSKNPQMVEFQELVKGLIELILSSPEKKKGENDG